MLKTLHFSNFEFSKKINDIAFKTGKNAVDIEKQYYFEILITLFNQYAPKICIQSSMFSKDTNYLEIDCQKEEINETYYDCMYLCHYLYNNFRSLKLNFTCSKKVIRNRRAFCCSLYFTSFIDEQPKVITFDLIPSNIEESDDNDSSSSSSSGGNALVKTLVKEQEIKDWLKKPLSQEISQIQMQNPQQQKGSSVSYIPEIQTSNKSVQNLSKIINSVMKNHPNAKIQDKPIQNNIVKTGNFHSKKLIDPFVEKSNSIAHYKSQPLPSASPTQKPIQLSPDKPIPPVTPPPVQKPKTQPKIKDRQPSPKIR